MGIFNKLFGTKGNQSVDTISADSIKNVWAVVDGKTIDFLKTKSREEQFAFGINVAKEIADEVYPPIQKWMDKNRCMVSIMMINPFVSDQVVEFIKKEAGTSPENQQALKQCKNFYMRTGKTGFGGDVAIVIGCK